MAEPRTPPGTPFQRLAAALGGSPMSGSREGANEGFKLDREAAIIEVSLTRGAAMCLVLRAHEEEAAPSSGYRKNVLLRNRARLVYPALLVRKTTSLDRVNTLFALRFEVRTGDAAFDRALTIEGDLSDEVIAQTFATRDARAAVLDIVGAGFTLQLEERSIRAELASPTEAHLTPAMLEPVIAALAVLVAHVPRADPSAFTQRPQAGRVLTGMILVTGLLAAAALAPGTLDDPAVELREIPRPVLPLPTMIPGVLGGTALFALAYLLLRWQLKRRNISTDLPLVLALFVVCGTLGVGLLDGTNRLLDDAPLAVHDVKIIAKDTARSRKSGMTNEWMLVVPSWVPQATQIELAVSAEMHGSVRVGDRLRVTVHPGFWGWQWGAVVDRAPGEAPPQEVTGDRPTRDPAATRRPPDQPPPPDEAP